MNFKHVMIRVQNIEKSIDFYQNLIGLKPKKTKTLEDCKLHFFVDGSGRECLELTENFEVPAEGYENGNAFGHLAFSVDNFDEFNKKIEKTEYKYQIEPWVLNDASGCPVSKIAFLKDPDGNEIELVEAK